MHLNKRIDWVDSLKFLGMFYIYIGHLGQSAGNIYPFVFSFHVPLFFFISGLFFSSTENNRKLMNSVYKSFKGILIPYFIFSFISVIIISIQNSASPHEVFEMVKLCLLGVRNNIPAGSLWFLPCLFLVVLYQSFLFRVLKSNVLIFIISFYIYINIGMWWNEIPSLFFNIDSAFYYLPYYAFGALIAKKLINNWLDDSTVLIRLRNYILITISFLFFIYSYFYGGYSLFNSFSSSQGRYACYFIMTIVLFIPSIALASKLNIRPILILGKNSILLCGTEQILKITIASFFSLIGLTFSVKNPLEAIIYTCLCFFVTYFTFLKIYLSFKKE